MQVSSYWGTIYIYYICVFAQTHVYLCYICVIFIMINRIISWIQTDLK